MAKKKEENMDKKYCRFVGLNYRDGFLIEDGGTIFVNGNELGVKYIDPFHFMVSLACFHSQEFYDLFVERGRNIVLPGKGLKIKEYGSNYKPYEPGTYQIVTLPDIGDELLEYSNLRIMKETLPLGRYTYDIMYEQKDNDWEEWLCEKAIFNHLGTVISCNPLNMSKPFIHLKQGIIFKDEFRKAE